MKRLCYLFVVSMLLIACGKEVKKTEEKPFEEKSPAEMTSKEFKKFIEEGQKIDTSLLTTIQPKDKKQNSKNVSPKWVMNIVKNGTEEQKKDPKIIIVLKEFYDSDSVNNYLTKEERQALAQFLRNL